MRKPDRLRKTSEFSRVFSTGRTISGKGLVLHWLPREAGPARIGLCVGRQLGKAVQRNRIKRLLRESWRSLAGGADAPADLVFVARRGGADYNLSQWTTAMRDVLARAGLISDRER